MGGLHADKESTREKETDKPVKYYCGLENVQKVMNIITDAGSILLPPNIKYHRRRDYNNSLNFRNVRVSGRQEECSALLIAVSCANNNNM